MRCRPYFFCVLTVHMLCHDIIAVFCCPATRYLEKKQGSFSCIESGR